MLFRSYTLNDGPHDFFARGITQRVDNSMVAVTPFTAKFQFTPFFVEFSTPLNQFIDSCGCFANHHVDDVGIAQFATGNERVGHVVFEAIVWA